MKIYSSEMEKFPFPRSEESIKSLAKFRGSSCNCLAAEALKYLNKSNNFILSVHLFHSYFLHSFLL